MGDTQELTANPAGPFGCHVGVQHSLTLGFPIVDGVKITTPVQISRHTFTLFTSLRLPPFTFRPSTSSTLALHYFLNIYRIQATFNTSTFV